MKKIASALLISLSFALSAFADQSYYVDLTQPEIALYENSSEKLDLSYGCGVYYNYGYGESWVMHVPGCSFIEMQFNKEEDIVENAYLHLTHLSSVVRHSFYSPISISVNGNTIVSGFSPASCNYITDSFDLLPYLQDGRNSVKISLDDDAVSNYWIQSIHLYMESYRHPCYE